MMPMAATTGSFNLPHGRPFTVHDLEAFPDDGNRYELIDGALLVSPAPGTEHQVVALELAVRLRERCPAGMRTLVAPFAVRPSDAVELQPDVLVTREVDLTRKNLPVAPLLAVEVLSPSSVLTDFNNKKAAYQRLGVPSYWVVDPLDPSLTVFELDSKGFRYNLVAEVKGDMAFEATQPFPVRIVPVDLLDGLSLID
jgi:Uma2 family endonuclease